MISVNNKVITEPYQEDRALKATVSNGFAMVSQKVQLKGLKVLMDASINYAGKELLIKEGDVVYVKEETLFTQAWAKKTYTSENSVNFMIVDFANIEFIDHKDA